MTRRTLTTILLVALLLGRIPAIAQPQTIDTSDIVILYDNDVHGAVEGYPLGSSHPMSPLCLAVTTFPAHPMVLFPQVVTLCA